MRVSLSGFTGTSHAVGSHNCRVPARPPATSGAPSPSLLLRGGGGLPRCDGGPVEDRVEEQLERAERLRPVLHAEGVHDDASAAHRHVEHGAGAARGALRRRSSRSGAAGPAGSAPPWHPVPARCVDCRSRRCSRTSPPHPAACRSRSGGSVSTSTRRSDPGQKNASGSSVPITLLTGTPRCSMANCAALPSVMIVPPPCTNARSAATPSSPESALWRRHDVRALQAPQQQRPWRVGQDQHVEAAAERRILDLVVPHARVRQVVLLEDPPRPSGVGDCRPTARTSPRAAGGAAAGCSAGSGRVVASTSRPRSAASVVISCGGCAAHDDGAGLESAFADADRFGRPRDLCACREQAVGGRARRVRLVRQHPCRARRR